MTDHFFSNSNKNQPSNVLKEENLKNTSNTQNCNSVQNNKKPKISHKVIPEKQISLYSINDSNFSKEKSYSKKNKSNNSNNNSSNLNQFTQVQSVISSNSNSQIPATESKEFKSKKSFESPLHQTKKFNAKTVTKTSKENFNEYKISINDPLASPIHNTSNSQLGFNNNKFSNNKMSNSNLPISTIPKAKINMSPSSTTHKSFDSNLSQNSIYNNKRSEKSDEENNKNHQNNNTSQLLNKNNFGNSDQANFNSNSIVPNNSLILLNTSNSVNVNNKKSNDFKLKYKTEKCKFWELYKECKYGDNVSNKNIILYK
jgi:hypothetical protein